MRSVGPQLVPLFRTEPQARVLAALFLHQDEDWTLAALARDLGVPASTLHPEVRRLEEAGLITARTMGRSRVLKAATSHPIAKPLTEILTYMYGPTTIIAEEFGSIAEIKLLLIFGSWAARQSGEAGPPPNDIDVLVVGDADRTAVYAAADRSQTRIGMPVNPVLASPRRWHTADDALIRQIKSSSTIDLTPSISPREHT